MRKQKEKQEQEQEEQEEEGVVGLVKVKAQEDTRGAMKIATAVAVVVVEGTIL